MQPVESGVPERGAPDSDSPEVALPEKGTPDIGIPESGLPLSDFMETGVPETGAPFSHVGALQAGRYKIRPVSTVQDGHSFAEQAVYEALWKAGKPVNEDVRVLTVGMRTLAEATRMTYNNCKENVQRLVQKLAIEEVGTFSYITGKTFRVFSYRKILTRRKQVGMTHIIRNRGVMFVDPETGLPLSGRQVSEDGLPLSDKNSAADSAEKGAPVSGTPMRE